LCMLSNKVGADTGCNTTTSYPCCCHWQKARSRWPSSAISPPLKSLPYNFCSSTQSVQNNKQ
jgi:hypothetical protein